MGQAPENKKHLMANWSRPASSRRWLVEDLVVLYELDNLIKLRVCDPKAAPEIVAVHLKKALATPKHVARALITMNALAME
ncbi:hypothetical protein OC844_008061, partial [Tilletia horrida]